MDAVLLLCGCRVDNVLPLCGCRVDALLLLCGCRVDAVLPLAAKYRPFMFFIRTVNLAGGVLEIMLLLCTLFKKELPFEQKKFSIVVDVLHTPSEYI